MAVSALLFAVLSVAQTALAAPLSMRADVASFNVTQNALDAQALNFIFGTLNATSSCSGQFESDMACVGNDVAVCHNGKWQTLDECGQFQCLALPILAGNGTTISCTNAAFADEIFEQLGVPGGFNETTVANMSSVVFPTLPSNATFFNSTDSDGEGDDCDGEDGGHATQTGTFTDAPATTITVPAASASAILLSISREGGSVVTSIMPSAASATAIASVTPSPIRIASSASASPTVIALTAAGAKPTLSA